MGRQQGAQGLHRAGLCRLPFATSSHGEPCRAARYTGPGLAVDDRLFNWACAWERVGVEKDDTSLWMVA